LNTTTTTPTFTAAEFRRRISKLVASSVDGGRGFRVEIGVRTNPVVVDHHPTHDEVWLDDDDLKEFITPKSKVAWLDQEGVRRHGSVLHIYLSSTGEWGGELENTITVWMGTPDLDPVLIQDPGGRPDNYGPEPVAPEAVAVAAS